MNNLSIGENIINLRRSRGITQDQLANFLNITKASVSKWETNQSFPDIMLLPKIATYFDITIDELLGYKPQLSPEQIRFKYHSLTKDFANLPFEEVMDKTKSLVKEYYACYPFLLQICVLWLNHFMFAGDSTRQHEILNDIVELCDHIIDECKVVGICSDATIINATINLQLGKVHEVIDILVPMNDPKRLSSQIEFILVQAYQMQGDNAKAVIHNQISMYSHLLSLVSSSINYLSLHLSDKLVGEETIKRLNHVINTYDLYNLNLNTVLIFHYQTALFYTYHMEIELAREALSRFVDGSLSMVKDGYTLHGDIYFNRLDEWFDNLDLGTQPPRDEKYIIESVKQAIEHPQLSLLFETKEYMKIKHILYQEGE